MEPKTTTCGPWWLYFDPYPNQARRYPVTITLWSDKGDVSGGNGLISVIHLKLLPSGTAIWFAQLPSLDLEIEG